MQSFVDDLFEPYRTDVFLDELLVTRGNVAAAARKAGLELAYARKLLAQPEWQRDFKRRYEAIYGPLDLRVQESMREWEALAHSDIRELYGPDGLLLSPTQLPDHVARAVASIKVRSKILDDGSETGEVISERTTEIKLWDKVTALGQLSRIQGLISNDVNITGKLQIETSPIAIDSLPLWMKLLLVHILENKPISAALQSSILAEVQPSLIDITPSQQLHGGIESKSTSPSTSTTPLTSTASTTFYVLNPWETSNDDD